MMNVSPHVIALGLGIMSFLALIPAAIALHRAHALRDWDSSTLFVVFVGLLGSLPTVLFALVSGRASTVDAFGNPQRDVYGNVIVGLSGWAREAERFTTVLLIGAGLVFFAYRCRHRTVLNSAALVAILLWLVTGLSDGLGGEAMFAPRQLALFSILLAAVVARPGRPAVLGAAIVGLLLTLLGGVQALFHEGSVFRQCGVDKCGPLGTLYTGVFANENTYALPLALSVAFIWIGLRGRSRIILAGYVAFVSFVTGSRMGEVTAGLTLAMLFALRPHFSDESSATHPVGSSAASSTTKSGTKGTPVGRPALALLGISASAFVGVILPFLELDPNSFGQRAYFWELARRQISASPVFGFGARAWNHLYQVSEIPIALTYSLHNEWLDVLYAGGLVGVALFAVLLVCILVRAGRDNFVVASCLVFPVLVASALERPWSFGISDWLSFALLATLLGPAKAVTVSVPNASMRSKTLVARSASGGGSVGLGHIRPG